MRLLRAFCALKKYGRVGSELVDDLPACAAGRTGDVLIIGDSDRMDFNLGSELRDRGEDCRAFGAVGHAVGSVLDVAAGKYLSVGQQDGRAHMKIRVGCVGVFHDFGGGLVELFAKGGANRLL